MSYESAEIVGIGIEYPIVRELSFNFGRGKVPLFLDSQRLDHGLLEQVEEGDGADVFFEDFKKSNRYHADNVSMVIHDRGIIYTKRSSDDKTSEHS